MKIVVYGAGSIGCYLGAILTKNNLDVTLLGRERILKTIQENGGIGISDFEGRSERIIHTEFSTDPRILGEADIILITLKCTAMSNAANELAEYCKNEALIICLQNGVNAEQAVLEKIPEGNIALGIVPFNVIQDDTANFHRATEGTLFLPDFAELKPIQKAFQEYGLCCELEKDMSSVIWGKLLLNLNNAINALSDLPLKTQLEQRGYRRILAACQEELLLACAKKGINLAQLTAVKPSLLPKILKLPDFIFKLIAQRMLAIDPKARSSMWEDIQFRRMTEIEYLNGAVVSLAESSGIAAPVNTMVTNLIKALENGEVEQGLTAESLLARFP